MMRLVYPLILLFSVCFLNPFEIQAQKKLENYEELKEAEDSLRILAEEMFTSLIPNGKMEAGLAFGKLLFQTLKAENAYKYPFDSLGQMIHVLTPDDKSFKIFNWLVSPDINIVRYYAIIQTKDELYPLVNYAEQLEESPTFLRETLDGKHWFGAEYYNLISRKAGKKNYYFLLGYNRDGTYTNKKILDVITFEDGKPLFGAPVFEFSNENGQKQIYHRILWQYKQGASFYLDYDTDRKLIAFDLLRSQINNPLRKNTYVPSGQVDGLKWHKGMWRFQEKIIEPMQLKDGQAPINGVIQR